MASVDMFADQLALGLGEAPCDTCLFSPDHAGGCPGEGSGGACTDSLNPAQEDFGERVTECGGLDLALTHASPEAPLGLPGFVPQVDGTEIGLAVQRPWIALRVREWRARARAVRSQQVDRNEVLHLAPGCKLVLLIFANDPYLERLWANRHEFLADLAALRPDAVVCPDFSVWLTGSWLERQYSIVRTIRFFGLVQELGIPAIPNVFMGDERQMDEWAEWLNTNPVVTIAMDLQCLQPTVRSDFYDLLGRFRRQLACPPDLLVTGLGDPAFVRAVASRWQNVSFSTNDWMTARKLWRTKTRPDGSTTRYRMPLGDPKALLLEEIERREAVINENPTLWSAALFGRQGPAPEPLAPAPDGLWRRKSNRHRAA